ncbi:uncharacterized protein LOC124207663 [Daphnia pulex]|uniref:uncharacterized protein LOC124207663 n=1 Tax=Daphnia pulex TaxID=6669 RepID=UPI001EDFF907|nr:uncharacterized protein LOC124207663 [Daphnia pulex]
MSCVLPLLVIPLIENAWQVAIRGSRPISVTQREGYNLDALQSANIIAIFVESQLMIDDKNGVIFESEIVIKSSTTTSIPPNLVSDLNNFESEIVIKSSTTTSIPPNLVSDLNNNSITTIFITCGILTVALLVFIAYICNRYNESGNGVYVSTPSFSFRIQANQQQTVSWIEEDV